MKYLAFDTSGSHVEILLQIDEKSFYAREENFTKASEILLKKADEMLSQNGCTLSELDYLGIITGPGSFTGIRIGLTSVKTLAYALGKRILTATSLEKLAAHPTLSQKVYALKDGGGGTAYFQQFDSKGDALSEAQCIFIKDAGLYLTDKNCPILSDNASLCGIDIIEVPCSATLLKSVFDRRIAEKASVGYQDAQAVYLRRAQAERKADEI